MKDRMITSFFYKWSPIILVIFHLVGIAIFIMPNRPAGLSGLNMLLCAVLVFGSAINVNKEFKLLVLIILGGFLIECVGVNTGLLFGSYEYGEELGYKVCGVPIVLGLNWYCIVSASSHIVLFLFEKQPIYFKAVLSGLFATAIDFLIEPVAIRYDFWSWDGGLIPIYNYLCWFLFATIFALAYHYYIKNSNRTAVVLFGIWLLFFLVLNIQF